jgi:hypothetical protein
MPSDIPQRRLLGRRSETTALDRLLEVVRAGESRALVIRGEPGVGKTALLEYVVERATGCRVAQAAGVQAEMELAFAGLHQLCAPMLDRLERLPGPQRDALGSAFGLSAGHAPDRFLVGLAVLSLLAEVRSGWIRLRRRRWRSSPGVSSRSRSASSSRSARAARSSS